MRRNLTVKLWASIRSITMPRGSPATLHQQTRSATMKNFRSIGRAAWAAMLAVIALGLAACGPMTITLGDQPDHARLVPNVIESDGGHNACLLYTSDAADD